MLKIIKKGLLTLTVSLLFMAAPKPADAQMMGQEMMGSQTGDVESGDELHESLDEVLAEFLAKYGKDTIQELDCNELTDGELERVGDAAMESMHPGEAHVRMDEMMGGEGSESLRLMHIQMGQRYLGCDIATSGGWGMGMMGPMMMFGNNMMDGRVSGYQWPVQASSSLGGLHTILVVITWISFIAFLIAGARYFWKKGNK